MPSLTDSHPTQKRIQKHAIQLKGWPILGVLPELSRSPPKFLDRVLKKFGSVVPMKVGPHRVILAGHPEAVKHVCVTNADNYEKTRFVEKLKPILGNGLATSNGAIWESSRRIIQPMLTQPQIKDMIGTMDRVIGESIEAWSEEPFDIAHASCSLTLKVISGTMFGETHSDAAGRVIDAIDIIQDYLSKSIWSILPFHQILKTKTYKAFQAAVDDIWALVHAMIVARKNGETKDDLLQALIDAVDPETGVHFSEQQIIDEVMTIFMAGHDTTGNTLCFFWDALASDPDLQERIRNEVLRCVPMDRSPSLDDLKKLELTYATLREVMRLYPSSWWFARTAIQNDEVHGISVRAGDTVMVAPYVTHRLAEFWPEPDKFDPNRFLDQKLTHKFAYIPFGAGPRMCPGSHFTLTEMLLTIARVVLKKELHKAETLECDALVTLRPRNGLKMSARSWSRVITVTGVRPGEHAFVDSLLRIRACVFVDTLGWPLSVDDDGREIDEFDNEDAEYSAFVANGEIKSFGRLRSTEKPSLLFDVYGYLIEDKASLPRGPTVWEGTRMGTNGTVPTKDRAYWLGQLVIESARRKYKEGVKYFCSVSDPLLERILRRTGIKLQRVGSVKTDPNGVVALALRLDCNIDDLALTKPDAVPFRIHVASR